MLEQILDSFLAYIETFIQGKNSKIYRVHLERATNHLEQASSEFLKNLERLGRVLHFYDRNLATLFAHIHYSKKGVLRNVFMFFVESSRKEVEKSYNDRYLFEDSSINKSGNQQVAKFKDVAIDQYHRGIEYTIPNNELMNLDLTEYLDGITRRADKSSFNPFYDPRSSLINTRDGVTASIFLGNPQPLNLMGYL
jgi:hypothetical protein